MPVMLAGFVAQMLVVEAAPVEVDSFEAAAAFPPGAYPSGVVKRPFAIEQVAPFGFGSSSVASPFAAVEQPFAFEQAPTFGFDSSAAYPFVAAGRPFGFGSFVASPFAVAER